MRNTTFCCIIVSLFMVALQLVSEPVSARKAAIEELNVQYFAGDPTIPPPIPPPPPLTVVDDSSVS